MLVVRIQEQKSKVKVKRLKKKKEKKGNYNTYHKLLNQSVSNL